MCEGGVRKMAYKLWTKMEGGQVRERGDRYMLAKILSPERTAG